MLPEENADSALRIFAPRLPPPPSFVPPPDSQPFMGVPFRVFRLGCASCCGEAALHLQRDSESQWVCISCHITVLHTDASVLERRRNPQQQQQQQKKRQAGEHGHRARAAAHDSYMHTAARASWPERLTRLAK